AWTLERMGTLCTRMGGLEDALVFHRRSMVLRRETSNYRGVASSLFYVGEILSKQGLDDQALIVFQESLSFWEGAHDYIGMAETYLGFATLHLKDDSDLFNTMRANELLAKCLRIAEELGLKRLEMRVHEALARSYKLIRLFEKALRHQEKVQALREIVSGEDVSKQIQQLEIALMRERAEKESERNRSESSELTAALKNLEEMNENLQKVVQEKNDVFSIVYHDLKNPIAGILVHTSTLERYIERMSTEDIRKTVNAVTKTAHRMRDIVTHLLTGDRGEAPAEAVMESVNICAVVRDVIAESSARAYAKSQSIHFAAGESDMFVRGVQSSLQRCVENFLSNAIKYSPNNRAITLTVEPSRRDGFVRCSVQDEGPGIHPDQVQLLFKSQAQVGSKTTGGEDSSGIGLVSVKRLIEQMNGEVGCDSQPGSGSTFFFEVPVWPKKTDQNTPIS
ncbi:MAG: ATP-binding protein, partial [Candidatus Kapaibacterium sp.]